MTLWNTWLALVNNFESACSRKTTFFWLVVALIGFTIHDDFLGVTSLARGAGLLSKYYTCFLSFFHSSALDLSQLRIAWVNIVFTQFNTLVRINGRCIIIGDGIKVAKEGKKMPGVKFLHQDSESNSKAEYIMGHSLQAVAILAQGLSTFFAVPLVGEIHEGIRFSYKDKRTLLDKMFEMLIGLKLPEVYYFVADKYYCSGRLMKQLVANNIHLITMMKHGAMVYYPVKHNKKGRGRPKKYGRGVKLFSLFDSNELKFIKAPMPNNPKVIIEYAVMELLWKPLGDFAKFVFVKHPAKGLSVVMSTDLSIAPLDIILAYSLRFKIEVLFKQAVHRLGTFMYRFWLKKMKSRKRGSGDQQLQFATKDFKDKVAKKLNAYHVFIQLGFIAQGLIQYLSIYHYQKVWSCFGSWLRTIRKNVLPSEMVVSIAMKNSYFEFLNDGQNNIIFMKFLRKKIGMEEPSDKYVENKKAA